MLTYEQWDAVADAVIPCLAACALLTPVLKSEKTRVAYYVALVVSVAVTTGLRVLNHTDYAVWPLVGVQYSGHTGMFMALGVSMIFWRLSLVWVISIGFVLYSSLMLYQGYHAVGDIVLTALAMGPLTWAIHIGTRRISANRASSRSAHDENTTSTS